MSGPWWVWIVPGLLFLGFVAFMLRVWWFFPLDASEDDQAAAAESVLRGDTPHGCVDCLGPEILVVETHRGNLVRIPFCCRLELDALRDLMRLCGWNVVGVADA